MNNPTTKVKPMKKHMFTKFCLVIAFLMLCTSNLLKAQAGAALNFTNSAPADNVVLPVALSNSLSTSNKITVEAWVKPTDLTSFGCIVGNYSTPNNQLQFLLRATSGQFQFLVGNSVFSSFFQLGSTAVPTLNVWQHVAGVWDGTVSAIYINGNLSGTLAAAGYSSMGVSSNTIVIGGNVINENFNGEIDEVRIWNIARTRCEINTFKDCEIPAGATGLLANYHFNQGTAGGNNTGLTSLTDASGNNYTGTLTSMALTTGTVSNWVSPGGVVSGFTTAVVAPTVTANSGTLVGGQSFTIVPAGASTYSFFPSGPVVSPSVNTTYTVIGTAATGCTSSALSSVTLQGAALSFDGSNDYVNLGTAINTSLSALNKITVEAWVYPTTNTGLGAIVGNYNTVLNQMQFLLRKTGANYELYIGNGSSANYTGIMSAATVTLNTWQHVAGTWDGSVARIYVNGVFSGSVSVTYPTFSTTTNQVWIGGNTAFGGEYFAGRIDEVRIWNRDLCVTELVNNLNAEIPTNASGLLANYHFNQGLSASPNAGVTTLTDATSSAVSGTLTNFALTGATSNWVAPGAVVPGSTVTAYTKPNITVNSGTICSGNSFTLAPSGASTYTFQGGSNTVSPGTTSSYTVIGTNSLGCITNTVAATVNVNTTPTVTVNNGTICSGSSFSVIPAGAATYTIQGGSSNVSPLSTTSYTVRGTSAQGCISANTATSSVTVNATPTVAVNNGTICSGTSFSIVPTGASTYTIQGGSTNVSPLANTSYTVRGTSAAGCISANTATSNVVVNTTPTVSVNSGTICSGTSFAIIPSGAATYTVQGGNFTVSPTSNTTYTLAGSSSNGCVSSVVSSTVTVTNCTSAAALHFDGSNDYVNLGTSINASLSTLNKITVEAWVYPTTNSGNGVIIGNYSTPANQLQFLLRRSGNGYEFFVGNGSSASYIGVPSLATTTLNTWQHVAGTWDGAVARIYVNGVYSNSISITYPTFNNTSNNLWIGGAQVGSGEYFQGGIDEVRIWNTAICGNELANNRTAEIPTNASGLIANYHFNQGLASNPNPTVTTLLGSISSPVTGTLTNFGLTGLTSNWIAPGAVVSGSTITPYVLPNITVNSGSICSGSVFTLTPSGAASYTFQGGASTVSPTSTASYTVVGTTSLGCITNTVASTVNVNTTPTVSVNSGTICSGSSFSIIPAGASTYTIEGGNSNVSPSANTTYTVIGSSAAGCLSANTATSSVSVNTTPTVSVNSGSICSGTSFSIIPTGASSYTIEGGNSSVSPLTNTTYTVNGTSAEGCVSANTATSSVTVNTTPTVTVNSGLICSGSSFSIIPAGASTYTIEGGNTSVSPLTNTSYTVNGTSAEGCVSANTAISSVTVNTTPTVSVNSGSICEGESFTITPSGALTYTISGGNTVVSPVTTSTYNVSGSSAEGCVSNNTAVSSVTVHAKPAVLVTSTSTMLCAGESVSLTASGALSYSWNTSENTAAITVTPATTTAYTVTGTDANGCSLTVSFSQEVNACTGLQNAVRASEIGMQVYPNPTNGAFTLELEGLSGEYTTLTLSNTLGQIVYRERTQLSQISLNISDLEAGLYILKAENKGLVKTVRIIKE